MSKTEKITKQELKGHDWFVTHVNELGHAILGHKTVIISLVVLILVGGAGWTAWSLYSESQEQKAQVLLGKAEGLLRDKRTEFDKAKMTPPVDPKSKEKPKEVSGPKPTGDLMVDYKEAVEALNNTISSYPKSQAAVHASLILGRLYFDHGKYAEMIPMLEKASKTAGHPVIKALVLNQLAASYDAQNQCDKAAGIWEEIAGNEKMSFIKGTALLNAGACYEKLDQKDKAESAYKKAENLNDPEAAKEAKKYLRFLKWGKQAS